MNILFFLEPRIELSSNFRYPTLRNSILPQMKALEKVGVKTHLVLGDAVAEKALIDGYLKGIKNYTVIKNQDLSNIVDLKYGQVAQELHNGNTDLEHKMAEFYKEKIHKFIPDIIISWESNVDYLKKIYPKSSIIYQWPGYLSRMPFPELISFDTGLLNNSHLNGIVENNISKYNEVNQWRNYISKYSGFLNSFNFFKEKEIFLRKKFKKIILCPLQVDNYFTVDIPLLNKKNQFDVVCSILDNISKDIGVIFTEYRSKSVSCNVLTLENVNYLKSKYENFIFDPEILDIPQISQYLVGTLDGVITISSSVGLQAALWKKPLLTIGDSHVTPFCSCNNFEDFQKQLYLNYENDKDNLIYFALRAMHPCMEDLKNNPKLYKNWLLKVHNKIQNQTDSNFTWPDFYSSNDEMIQSYEKYNKISDLIVANKKYFKEASNNISGVCNELSAQIQKKSIISFDIFDTLLVRPFAKPSDLFDFISSDVGDVLGKNNFNFTRIRKEAEQAAFKLAIQRGEGETTIDEIYEEFVKISKISKFLGEKVKLLEIQAESKYLYRREAGYKAYLEAHANGKEIILVSDMYLSKDILQKILEKNGYIFHKELFVSSETKFKKHNGKMFDYILNNYSYDKHSILHVGDNVDADVKMPKSKGIKAFHLPKTIDKFKESSAYNIWKRDESRHSLDWRILISLVANNFFDNPYIDFRKNTLFNGDIKRLGFYGAGPLFFGFTKWIIENAIKDKVEEIYFLARDGKIIKEIYDLISPYYNNAPKSTYLLCSRRAVNLSKVKSVDDIFDLASVDYSNNVKLGFLLENRFGLRLDQIDKKILLKHNFRWDTKLPADNKEIFINFCLDIKDIILSVAEYERNNYVEYLDSLGVLNCSNKAVVDIGYAGTMQESLSKISNSKLSGYYFITFRKALERIKYNDMDCKGYLGDFIDRHDTFHPFCKHVPLYETIFSNTDTSLIRFEKKWDMTLLPVFMDKSDGEEDRINFVTEVHLGIISYSTNFINIFEADIKKIDIEPNKSLRVLTHFFNDPHPVEARLLCNIKFEDAYGGGGIKNLLCTQEKISTEDCIWVKGKEVMIRDLQLKTKDKGETKSKVDIKNNITCENQGNSISYLNSSSDEAKSKWFNEISNVKYKLKDELYKKVLDERKYNKLYRNKELFLMDIKNPIIRKLAKKIV